MRFSRFKKIKIGQIIKKLADSTRNNKFHIVAGVASWGIAVFVDEIRTR
jgi:hypothetical protein